VAHVFVLAGVGVLAVWAAASLLLRPAAFPGLGVSVAES
jgi:hypothetical protein